MPKRKENGRSSSRGIKLHPEYGINPSLAVCFWCGKETGEIVLFGGELKGEAPRTVVATYNPCEDCRKKWDQGYLLLEAVDQPLVPGHPPIREGTYPTGNYAVISHESAEKLIKDPSP